MALSKKKNTWLTLEINAKDFMPDELIRMVEDATKPIDTDKMEQKLNIIADKGAHKDDIGIPDFQNWFYTNHNWEWRLMTTIINAMISKYIDEKLKKAK